MKATKRGPWKTNTVAASASGSASVTSRLRKSTTPAAAIETQAAIPKAGPIPHSTMFLSGVRNGVVPANWTKGG
ncbi:MAG: hypothetical protein IPI33_00570 [Dehalococcoidia bacterium]|nr:hypothetical protein [Dehalococcoidia bacterium]